MFNLLISLNFGFVLFPIGDFIVIVVYFDYVCRLVVFVHLCFYTKYVVIRSTIQ